MIVLECLVVPLLLEITPLSPHPLRAERSKDIPSPYCHGFATAQVDLAAVNGPVDLLGLQPEGALERFEKFIFCGDDRSIKAVYVDGKQVSGTAMMAEKDLVIKKK